MYKNNDTNIAGLEWLQQKSKVKILGQIRYTDKAAESTFFNKAAYEYSPRCGAAQDYYRLDNLEHNSTRRGNNRSTRGQQQYLEREA